MECVSELDETVREKYIKLFQKVETDKRNELYKKIIKIYKKSNDGRNKSLKNFLMSSLQKVLFHAMNLLYSSNHFR